MSVKYVIVRTAGTSATIPNILRGKRVKLQSQNTTATSPLVRTDRKPVTIQDSLPRKPRCSLMPSTNVITQLAEGLRLLRSLSTHSGGESFCPAERPLTLGDAHKKLLVRETMIQRQCPECSSELVLARRPDNRHGPRIVAGPCQVHPHRARIGSSGL